MSTKRKKKTIPKGYDSRLEYDLHKNELKGLTYHPEERIHYVTTHSYEPDFTTEICLSKDCSCTQRRRCGSSKTILVEVKGRFRERKEASKYIDIRRSLEEQYEADCNWGEGKEKEVIFLFQDASKPMPFAQKRKDGTKQTHREWAEKNKFRYYCLKKGLPKTWLTDLT